MCSFVCLRPRFTLALTIDRSYIVSQYRHLHPLASSLQGPRHKLFDTAVSAHLAPQVQAMCQCSPVIPLPATRCNAAGAMATFDVKTRVNTLYFPVTASRFCCSRSRAMRRSIKSGSCVTCIAFTSTKCTCSPWSPTQRRTTSSCGATPSTARSSSTLPTTRSKCIWSCLNRLPGPATQSYT